ncbi:S8 family peptidase [Mycoplasma mycoides subsp. capri]|uniref:S8 family peptidase n=1 Tax=Mycoplasma mycoides TaxID=2102 RepID=UPI00223F9DD9|nr:S8 family peptidase [Mycoplasma mycoides]UZK64171.1 S8 family peptidase [Mycoplasma mycoides subsp. capri]
MNNLIVLKGKFEPGKNTKKPNSPQIPKTSIIKLEDCYRILDQLIKASSFWKEQKIDINPIINVKYKRIISKSNRVSYLLLKSLQKNNEHIIGSSFLDELVEKKIVKKQVITYCLTQKDLQEAIKRLDTITNILKKNHFKRIDNNLINLIANEQYLPIKKEIQKYEFLSKTVFISTLVDLNYIEEIFIKTTHIDNNVDSVVTLYDTGIKAIDLLNKLDINVNMSDFIDDYTLFLDRNQYNELKTKAPFLISMSVDDLTKFIIDDEQEKITKNDIISIPDPTNEPIVGVIDTMFCKDVYFSKWVDFRKEVSDDILLDSKDYQHGTQVSSIIVDGPSFNKKLEDGCGRFRVRHFGVMAHSSGNVFSLFKKIKSIVINNLDIKVWNLSLGSIREVSSNYISLLGSLLDQLQYENDVIFIVAGTNDNECKQKIVGSPADSINSIVVNSVDFKNKPANYSRKGPVLTYFNKPDISYYGGVDNNKITVCGCYGETKVQGTSFAAPWITRKVAYLIYKMNYSKEEAKALIIDSAIKFDKQEEHNRDLIGYGVVPIHINEILQSKNTDIKVLLSYNTKAYYTYNFNLPVPTKENKFPFIAKLTFAYFAESQRSQGVDYTQDELDIQFGPIDSKSESINDINENNQSSSSSNAYIYEYEARKVFAKWNTVKSIIKWSKTNKGKKRQFIKTTNNRWGIRVIRKTRTDNINNKSIKFSLVITFRSIDNKDRIEEFISLCNKSGYWVASKVQIDNKIDIHGKSNEYLDFE